MEEVVNSYSIFFDSEENAQSSCLAVQNSLLNSDLELFS